MTTPAEAFDMGINLVADSMREALMAAAEPFAQDKNAYVLRKDVYDLLVKLADSTILYQEASYFGAKEEEDKDAS